MPKAKTAFVTVGTTKFDKLIQSLDSIEVLRALKVKGFSKLIVQHGRGAYEIQHLNSTSVKGLTVECALLNMRRVQLP